MENFGFRELYDVFIKTPFPLKIGEREYDKNETIFSFDKIILSNLNENTLRQEATGGRGNPPLVFWENTKEVSFSLTQGVLSPEGFALLSNSNILNAEKNTTIIDYKETKETDENGVFSLKYLPIQNDSFFLYDKISGEKVNSYTINGKEISSLPPFKEYLISYTFTYEDKSKTLSIGEKLINGYLELSGKIRLKDDYDGRNKTGIIKIPKMRLMSDLSLRLGEKAAPQTNTFFMVGYPVDINGKKTVCDIVLLEDDIDSDF